MNWILYVKGQLLLILRVNLLNSDQRFIFSYWVFLLSLFLLWLKNLFNILELNQAVGILIILLFQVLDMFHFF